MGDRYDLIVKCECGEIDDDVWYAPTCGCISWTCPKCGKIIDLEEYSGIDAEGCANTNEGIKCVKELKKDLKKRLKKQKEVKR